METFKPFLTSQFKIVGYQPFLKTLNREVPATTDQLKAYGLFAKI